MQCLGPAQVSHKKANMYMKGSALGGVQVINSSHCRTPGSL
jgi:hypothetical protein